MVRMYSTALTPFSPLLEWYDRNPADRTINYSAVGVAPHVLTERASYTVPSGKKAFVGGAAVLLLRDGTPTTAAPVNGNIIFGANGTMWVSHTNATLNSSEKETVTFNGVLLEGTTLKIYTQDTSNGGSYTYRICCVAMEFNA